MVDTARLTDERLKSMLNGNQPSRERLCLGILALDRNYNDVQPRRPEGGPDGSRDIECTRLGEKCYGAVGFKNSVCDSQQDKKDISKKFRDDVLAARGANSEVKSFVFFCNIDMSPSEVNRLKKFANKHDFTQVDIYWRERIRHALDSPEGLALRYQYLGLNLSDAEQAAFFARYGKELEDLLHGRFDRIEKKIDAIEFSRWRTGYIRKLKLDIQFKEDIDSNHNAPEHFRIALELKGDLYEERSIIIGGRDDFWLANGKYYFDTKTFFSRQGVDKSKDSWIKKNMRIGGGVIDGIYLGVHWHPVSPILAEEFDHLYQYFHFTENLMNRIDRVRFTIDDYVFLDWKFSTEDIRPGVPSFSWPDNLNEEELAVRWYLKKLWSIKFDEGPFKQFSS
jgi:hypothetical protein